MTSRGPRWVSRWVSQKPTSRRRAREGASPPPPRNAWRGLARRRARNPAADLIAAAAVRLRPVRSRHVLGGRRSEASPYAPPLGSRELFSRSPSLPLERGPGLGEFFPQRAVPRELRAGEGERALRRGVRGALGVERADGVVGDAAVFPELRRVPRDEAGEARAGGGRQAVGRRGRLGQEERGGARQAGERGGGGGRRGGGGDGDGAGAGRPERRRRRGRRRRGDEGTGGGALAGGGARGGAVTRSF